MRAEGQNPLLDLQTILIWMWPRTRLVPGMQVHTAGSCVALIHQHPHVLLSRAALNPFSVHPVFVLGITLMHVKDLALGLAESPVITDRTHQILEGAVKIEAFMLSRSFWRLRESQIGSTINLAEVWMVLIPSSSESLFDTLPSRAKARAGIVFPHF